MHRNINLLLININNCFNFRDRLNLRGKSDSLENLKYSAITFSFAYKYTLFLVTHVSICTFEININFTTYIKIQNILLPNKNLASVN